MWSRAWERNGWIKDDGLPVANVELFKRLKSENRVNILYKYVPAHVGVDMNEEADMLAKRACGIFKNQRVESEPPMRTETFAKQSCAPCVEPPIKKRKIIKT